MNIYANSLIYDGKSSIEHSLKIANFNNSGLTIGEGTTIELDTIQIGDKKKSITAKYSDAISIKVQLIKNDYTEITNWEFQAYMRWYLRNDNKYYYLQFVQPDYEEIFFRVKCTSCKSISVANRVVGIELTFQTDAPYGYSKEYTDTYNFGTVLTPFINFSEEIGEIYPDLTINITEDCTIALYNNLTKKTTQIDDCVANEVITYNAQTEEWLSSTNRNVIASYNFVPFSLANVLNTRKNLLSFYGSGTVTLKYRLIKKVGV